MTLRIAMWSGPRNISTAMMRSWGSRPDTAVVDEPLYARYLALTGADHPAREQTIASGETDLGLVVDALLGEAPGGRAIFYQKHMAHHLLEGDPLDWVLRLRNAVLVREPRAMIASFDRVVPDPTPAQLGLPQQVRLLEFIAQRTGSPPPVVCAEDVRLDPRRTLRALCERLGVSFDERMLRWAPGPRSTDGPWAPHWYGKLYQSTGFAPPEPSRPELEARLAGVLDACLPLYQQLAAHAIRP